MISLAGIQNAIQGKYRVGVRGTPLVEGFVNDVDDGASRACKDKGSASEIEPSPFPCYITFPRNITKL
jgi:hypothetical protein